MLKKYKTFDLERERGLNQPKSEKFYEPKKSKYFKYAVIPFMIAFILLCILVNVHSTGKAYSYLNGEINSEKSEIILTEELRSYVFTDITNNNDNDDKQATIEMGSHLEKKTLNNLESNLPLTTTGKIPYESQTPKNLPVVVNETMEFKENMLQATMDLTQTESLPNKTVSFTSFVGAAKCEAIKSNCSLFCSGGTVSYIDEDLNSLRFLCPNTDLSLILQNCEFYKGTLTSTFFVGDFILKYLSIINCNLETIQALTFKQNNVKNLQTLILRNNFLTTLTATTFDGLVSLKYFEFTQLPLKNNFNAEQFLKPVSSSLTQALISQMTDKQEVLNPKTWLQGSDLTALITLDMSNSNFQDVLDPTTFRTLIAVEILNLANCSLLTITEPIFASIKYTLRYLDLSRNNLQTFDLPLLNLVALQNIRINLTANEWYCDCENNEIIEFFQQNIELTETVLCYAPEKWQSMEMKEVIRECQKDIEVITTTTISIDSSTTEISDTPNSTTTMNISEHPFTTTTNIFTSTAPEISEDSPTTSSEIPFTTKTTQNSENPSESTIITEIVITTTRSPNTSTISIVCYGSNTTDTTFWLSHITFIITTSSASSVAIEIPDTLKNFHILYFTNYNNYMNLTQLQYTISNNTIFIHKLVTNTAYIFCLITNPQVPVSPLQCQGHFVGIVSKSWLSTEDQCWFIPVIIAVNIIIIIFVVFVVYLTLHKYPTWLINQNGRILKVNNDSHKVVVLSRQSSKIKETKRSSNYLTAQQPTTQAVYVESNGITIYASKHTVPSAKAPNIPQQMENRKSSCPSYNTAQNNDAAATYLPVIVNRFQSLNDEGNLLYSSRYKAPDVRAPKLPPFSSFDKSQTCMQYVEVEPDYQTIDHYEVVNF